MIVTVEVAVAYERPPTDQVFSKFQVAVPDPVGEDLAWEIPILCRLGWLLAVYWAQAKPGVVMVTSATVVAIEDSA